MMRQIDGYDFDGTVLRGIAPQRLSDVIITGRPYHDYKVTLRQLKLLGFDDCLVWFNPAEPSEVNAYTAALHKSNIIKRIGVENFYEDNIFQALFIHMATDATVQLVQTVDCWGEVKATPLVDAVSKPVNACVFPFYAPLVGKRSMYNLHTIVWEGVYGKIPVGYSIKHLDGDVLNWHLDNLQLQARNGVDVPSGWILNTAGEPIARKCPECRDIKTVDMFQDALGEVCRVCQEGSS